jgi:hypothetical protein
MHRRLHGVILRAEDFSGVITKHAFVLGGLLTQIQRSSYPCFRITHGRHHLRCSHRKWQNTHAGASTRHPRPVPQSSIVLSIVPDGLPVVPAHDGSEEAPGSMRLCLACSTDVHAQLFQLVHNRMQNACSTYIPRLQPPQRHMSLGLTSLRCKLPVFVFQKCFFRHPHTEMQIHPGGSPMIMPANGLPMMLPGAMPSWPGAYVPSLAFSLDCGALLRGSAQTSTRIGAGPSQVSPSAASPKLAPRLKVTRVLCTWCDFPSRDCLVPLVPHSSRSLPNTNRVLPGREANSHQTLC